MQADTVVLTDTIWVLQQHGTQPYATWVTWIIQVGGIILAALLTYGFTTRAERRKARADARVKVAEYIQSFISAVGRFGLVVQSPGTGDNLWSSTAYTMTFQAADEAHQAVVLQAGLHKRQLDKVPEEVKVLLRAWIPFVTILQRELAHSQSVRPNQAVRDAVDKLYGQAVDAHWAVMQLPG